MKSRPTPTCPQSGRPPASQALQRWVAKLAAVHLAVLFGVVTLPKATLSGIWDGKDGHHWQHHPVDIDVRSPKLAPALERDLELLEALEG